MVVVLKAGDLTKEEASEAEKAQKKKEGLCEIDDILFQAH